MRFVDKIAKSKYFQKATETEFIKKKMEEVSNTPLLLTVEVQECRGTLAVNIPPPPTDRIWYVKDNLWELWMWREMYAGEQNTAPSTGRKLQPTNPK